MKRFGWAGIAVLVTALPLLLRSATQQPLLGGTEAYMLAGYLTAIGIPPAAALTAIIVGTLAAIGFSMLLIEPLLREWPRERATALAFVIATPAVLASLSYPSHALFLLLLAGAFTLAFRKNTGAIALFAVLLVLVGLKVVTDGTRSPGDALVELGGLNAYGLFTLIASVVGLATLWENKARNYYITLAVLALIVLSFFFPTLMLFGSLAVAVAAGIGIARLRRQKWTYPLIRTLTLVLFLCGALFAAISAIFLIADSPPDAGLASGLSEVRFAMPQGNILTHPSYAPWVEHWTGQPVPQLPDDIYESLWTSRNLESTTRTLDQYAITSIIITPEMKQGLVWSGDEEGLLFLLSHSTKFKRVPSASTVEVWAYTPAESS